MKSLNNATLAGVVGADKNIQWFKIEGRITYPFKSFNPQRLQHQSIRHHSLYRSY